jgi:hypothetical protein
MRTAPRLVYAVALCLSVFIFLQREPPRRQRAKTNRSKTVLVHPANSLDGIRHAPQRHHIPVMILVGNRIEYFRRVWHAVRDANGNHSRICFLIGEETDKATSTIQANATTSPNLMLSIHKIELSAANRELKGPERLKHIWFAAMHRVWDSDLLSNYSGDVVFLEDDVVPSSDFFVALEFTSNIKRQLALFQLIAMGGWGGENQVDASARTFTLKASKSFPTMGYAFNRSLWAEIEKVEYSMLADSACLDWAECLSNKLWTQAEALWFPLELVSFHQAGFVKLIQPTLSRVLHIGSVSQVGSRHQGDSYRWPTRPSWELAGTLLRNHSEAILVSGMRDVFGFPSPDWRAVAHGSDHKFPPPQRHDLVSSMDGSKGNVAPF